MERKSYKDGWLKKEEWEILLNHYADNKSIIDGSLSTDGIERYLIFANLENIGNYFVNLFKIINEDKEDYYIIEAYIIGEHEDDATTKMNNLIQFHKNIVRKGLESKVVGVKVK